MASIPLLNLWNKRSLVFHFAWMNIKVRFKGTYLGLLWTAIEPTLFFVFLYILFTNIRIITRDDFAIYFLTGIIIYHTFIRGTQAGLGSLKNNFAILSSINIRREFFPVVATSTTFILLFVEIGVFFGLMPFFQFIPSWTIVLLPIVLAMLLLLILGMSYLLSIIFVYAKDIQPVWAIITSVLFFITPIFWYLEDASGIVLEVQKINPVGQLIEITHGIVFGSIPPLSDWLYTMAIIMGIFVLGYTVFQKYEKNALEQM